MGHFLMNRMACPIPFPAIPWPIQTTGQMGESVIWLPLPVYLNTADHRIYTVRSLSYWNHNRTISRPSFSHCNTYVYGQVIEKTTGQTWSAWRNIKCSVDWPVNPSCLVKPHINSFCFSVSHYHCLTIGNGPPAQRSTWQRPTIAKTSLKCSPGIRVRVMDMVRIDRFWMNQDGDRSE